MQWYDSGALGPFVSPDDSVFAKTMINTGSGTGVWNAIYGAQAWYQLNTEANLFGTLPKLSWDKSGFRAVTGWTRTAASMAITETGTLPTPTTPTITTIKYTPKIAVNTFQTTQVLEQLAKLSQDDIYGNLDTNRMYYATEHVKLLNQQLNSLAVGTSTATCVDGSTITTFETIDRIVASNAEGVAVGLTSGTTPTLAHVVSPYAGAVSRSSAGNFDSQVISPSGTIGTAASLTDASLRQLIQQCKTAGGYNNFWITGYNTYQELQGLYLSNWRTVNWGELRVQTGVNGIKTADGLDTGLAVSSVYGIPIIQAVDTPASQTTSGGTLVGVQNMYLLDATDTEGYGDSRLGVQVLNPTNYLETSARDFLLLNSLSYIGSYFTLGEQTCRFFSAQGKIRDIN
jgi:hypothetical protein